MIKRLNFDTRPPNAGRNWLAPQARTRLVDEASKRFNAEQRNAVAVHGTPVRYFSKLTRGVTCTCHLRVNTNTPLVDEEDREVVVTFKGYEKAADDTYDDDLFDDDLNSLSEPEGPDVNNTNHFGVEDDLFANNRACAVCYRTGIVGGYQELHHDRQVIDVRQATNGVGYSLYTHDSPHSFHRTDKNRAFVEFDLSVPLAFENVTFGVFNNKDLLNVTLYDDQGQELGYDYLRENAGDMVKVLVKGVDVFTHFVVNFKLPTLQLVADFPQDNVVQDYTKFKTAAQQTAVLTNLFPTANVGDLIVKVRPNAFSVWQATDNTGHHLENGYNMGHTITVRLVQPDEMLFNITNLHNL